MSNEKGIFEPQEGFASPHKSPFAADDGQDSPFAAPKETKSPFTPAGEDEPRRSTSELPSSSPFASGESKSPFGYEPEAAKPGDSPFGVAKDEPEPAPAPFAAASTPEQPAAEPAREPAPAAAPGADDSDYRSIKQLELRAIFGVDRELNEGEMLQRSRALPGVRNLSRVSSGDADAVDGVKRLVASLGFGEGQVKLYCGSAPIEFIREGPVLLAVQTDGGFAPGVRETLMIVARELGRL